MMKIFFTLIAIVFFICSCRTTKSDAVNWMDKHKLEAAEYCSDRYPSEYKVDTVELKQDSTAYFKALSNLWRLTDSAKQVLEASGKIDSFYLESLLPCIGNDKIITITTINRDSVALLLMKLKAITESNTKKDQAINQLKKESGDFKQKAKNRFWIIVAFAATMIGMIIIKVR